MRCFVVNIFFLIAMSSLLVAAQESSLPSGSAVCTFTDGNQISVRYSQPMVTKEPLPIGKTWMPGGTRMELFTETALKIAQVTIPPGAYALYFIPGKDSWTLAVNKNVAAGATYDQQQDLVRETMQTEKLEQPEKQLTIYFGHTAPKQCMMRVDYGKVRAVGEINEQ
jgi:hypothetical protein